MHLQKIIFTVTLACTLSPAAYILAQGLEEISLIERIGLQTLREKLQGIALHNEHDSMLAAWQHAITDPAES